ncbi:MAG: hypothetical protein LRY68_11350 [Sulfurospirillum sp.]|nr:hypothetical protein [Sulfurospirillum sp.]
MLLSTNLQNSQRLINTQIKKMWIKEMAQKDSQEFIFPVNELFMQIDLAKELGGNGKTKIVSLGD